MKLLFFVLLALFVPVSAGAAQWTRLPVLKNSFACIDDNLTWEIGTKMDNRVAVYILTKAKDSGICIDLRPGELFYTGSFHKRYSGLVEIRRTLSSPSYWTALGLFL